MKVGCRHLIAEASSAVTGQTLKLANSRSLEAKTCKADNRTPFPSLNDFAALESALT
jgi:hypothetical protein